MKLTLKILQDEGDPLFYEINNAPDDDTAIMLAFAMDGGFGPEIEDYGSSLALAKMHTSIELRDGKSKAQLKTEYEAWEAEHDRRDAVWGEWMQGKDIEHAYPSVSHNPGDIAVNGVCQLVLYHDGFYGEGRDFIGPILEDPTWGDVMLHFDRAIKTTGDYHHIFLEGLRLLKEPEGEVDTFEFSTGS